MKSKKVFRWLVLLLAAVFALSLAFGFACSNKKDKGGEEEGGENEPGIENPDGTETEHVHDYVVTGEWEWSSDFSSCTAEATCQSTVGTCDAPTATLEADSITSNTTKEATCSEEGSLVYVAEYEGKKVKESDPVTIAKTPHTYDETSEEWSWGKNDAGAAVGTLTLTCTICQDEWTSSATVGELTDEETGEYTVTIYDRYGEAHFGTHIVADSDQYVHVHDYVVTSDWAWDDARTGYTRTRTCQNTSDGQCTAPTVEDRATIESNVTKEATCTEAGEKTYTMTFTGENPDDVLDETETETIPALGHDYSDEWTWSVANTSENGADVTGTCKITCSRCDDTQTLTPAEAQLDENTGTYGTYTATATHGEDTYTGTYEPTVTGITIAKEDGTVIDVEGDYSITVNETESLFVTVALSDGRSSEFFETESGNQGILSVSYTSGESEITVVGATVGETTLTITAGTEEIVLNVTVGQIKKLTVDFSEASTYSWIENTGNNQTWTYAMLTVKTVGTGGSVSIDTSEGYYKTGTNSSSSADYFMIDLTGYKEKYVSVKVTFGANAEGTEADIYLSATADNPTNGTYTSYWTASSTSADKNQATTYSMVYEIGDTEALYILHHADSYGAVRIYSIEIEFGDDMQKTDYEAQPVSVSITGDTSTLKKVDDTCTLTASVTMSDGSTYDGTYSWSSNHTTYATVQGGENGTATITAKADGTVTIKVTVTGTSHHSVSDSVEITLNLEPYATAVQIGVESGKTLEKTGDSATVVATVGMSENGATYSGGYTWSSSNQSVATVTPVSGTNTATVTIIGYGTATITVTLDGGVTNTLSISINGVTGVSLDKTSISVEAGKSGTLNASVSLYIDGSAYDVEYTWTSSDGGVITIAQDTADGSKVAFTAMAAGSATITVTAEGKSATCAVTVTEPVNYGGAEYSVSVDGALAASTIATGTQYSTDVTVLSGDDGQTSVTINGSPEYTWNVSSPNSATEFADYSSFEHFVQIGDYEAGNDQQSIKITVTAACTLTLYVTSPYTVNTVILGLFDESGNYVSKTAIAVDGSVAEPHYIDITSAGTYYLYTSGSINEAGVTGGVGEWRFYGIVIDYWGEGFVPPDRGYQDDAEEGSSELVTVDSLVADGSFAVYDETSQNQNTSDVVYYQKDGLTITVLATGTYTNIVNSASIYSVTQTEDGRTFTYVLYTTWAGQQTGCSIKIEVDGPCTITLYAMGGESVDIKIGLYDESFAYISGTSKVLPAYSSGGYISAYTFAIPDAGTYYISSTDAINDASGGNSGTWSLYAMDIDYTQIERRSDGVAAFDDFVALGKLTVDDGSNTEQITEDIVFYTADGVKITITLDSTRYAMLKPVGWSNTMSTAEDGTEFSYELYFAYGGSQEGCNIKIEVDGPCTIVLYATAEGSIDRKLGLFDESFSYISGTAIELPKVVDNSGNKQIDGIGVYTIYIDEAGTYYLASAEGITDSSYYTGFWYLYGMRVTYGLGSPIDGEDVTVDELVNEGKLTLDAENTSDVVIYEDETGVRITVTASDAEKVTAKKIEEGGLGTALDGKTFENLLYIESAGSSTGGAVKIELVGPCTIVLYAAGTSSSVKIGLFDESFNYVEGSYMVLPADGSAIQLFIITIDAKGTYYIASSESIADSTEGTAGGWYLYGMTVAYDGPEETTDEGGTSVKEVIVSVDNSEGISAGGTYGQDTVIGEGDGIKVTLKQSTLVANVDSGGATFDDGTTFTESLLIVGNTGAGSRTESSIEIVLDRDSTVYIYVRGSTSGGALMGLTDENGTYLEGSAFCRKSTEYCVFSMDLSAGTYYLYCSYADFKNHDVGGSSDNWYFYGIKIEYAVGGETEVVISVDASSNFAESGTYGSDTVIAEIDGVKVTLKQSTTNASAGTASEITFEDGETFSFGILVGAGGSISDASIEIVLTEAGTVTIYVASSGSYGVLLGLFDENNSYVDGSVFVATGTSGTMFTMELEAGTYYLLDNYSALNGFGVSGSSGNWYFYGVKVVYTTGGAAEGRKVTLTVDGSSLTSGSSYGVDTVIAEDDGTKITLKQTSHTASVEYGATFDDGTTFSSSLKISGTSGDSSRSESAIEIVVTADCTLTIYATGTSIYTAYTLLGLVDENGNYVEGTAFASKADTLTAITVKLTAGTYYLYSSYSDITDHSSNASPNDWYFYGITVQY